MEITLVILCLLLYFLPAIIANEKRQGCAIGVLNLLLGWTIIGWVVALVWAFCNDPEPVNINQPTETMQSKTSQYDELEKLAELKDKGIISENEFEEQKQKILGTNEQDLKRNL